MRPASRIASEWWDYTTLDRGILDEAASLSPEDLPRLARDGFTVAVHDTLEEFYLAEALEYVGSWRQSSADHPAGICGPIGPTKQLPLVARLVNELEVNLQNAHFWAMDEWAIAGKEVGPDFPFSFARIATDLCFSRIRPDLRMPSQNIHVPKADTSAYAQSWDTARCVVMQGGQGDAKHWAFNDPPKRQGIWAETPPPPDAYLGLGTRVVDLHPLTLLQNARTYTAGMVQSIPTQAVTVGPLETWKAEKVSIWHPGHDDNPFGIRLTAFMISKRIVDTSVPMSLLSNHPNVQFNFFRGGIGTCMPPFLQTR